MSRPTCGSAYSMVGSLLVRAACASWLIRARLRSLSLSPGHLTCELLNRLALTESPIKEIKDKWRLLPAFLRVRGLVKQHLDSYNHLVNIEIKHIVRANERITVDNHPWFYLKFLDVYLGAPSVEEDMSAELTWESGRFTPQECRLRDITYSAPVKVDVEYTVGKQPKRRRGVTVGRMPIMLRSNKCILHARSEEELARMGECECTNQLHCANYSCNTNYVYQISNYIL